MLLAIKSSRLTAQCQLWVPFLLAASMLAVPISPSAKSICIGIVIALIMLTKAYRQDLVAMLSKPWCQASLLLFFIALIACIWSPAFDYQKIGVLKKYMKFMFLPILVVGFRDPRARRLGSHAFLVAMAITCVLSMLKAAGMLDYNGPDHGRVFNNHIMTSFMMAFATYLSALLCTRERGGVRVFYALLALLFSYQILFINTGRMGYVVYVLLMILLMVQMLPWRKAIFAIFLGGALFAVTYYHSAPMHHIVRLGIVNYRDYQQGQKNSSIGYRLQFHAYAKKLFLRHPWFGNGTGSYTYFFRTEDPVPAWHQTPGSVERPRISPKNLFEPHSQYWFLAAEFGMMGILAVFFFFGSLVVASLRLHSMRAVAIGLIVSFIVGNLSDSLLFYGGTGYFFLLFMAMCLGEEQELRAASKLQAHIQRQDPADKV